MCQKILKQAKSENFIDQWRKITSDSEILTWVAGVKIDFSELPSQERIPFPIVFTLIENDKIQIYIDRMVNTKIIQNVLTHPVKLSAIYSPGTKKMVE